MLAVESRRTITFSWVSAFSSLTIRRFVFAVACHSILL